VVAVVSPSTAVGSEAAARATVAVVTEAWAAVVVVLLVASLAA
jgi:hypothetical protein